MTERDPTNHVHREEPAGDDSAGTSAGRGTPANRLPDDLAERVLGLLGGPEGDPDALDSDDAASGTTLEAASPDAAAS